MMHQALSTGFSRRSFLQSGLKVGGLAVGATAGLGLLAPRADAASGSMAGPTTGLQTIQPMHSDKIAQSYGVQLHSSWNHTVYTQYDAIATLLAELGVRSVRDKLAPAVPGSVAFLKRLAGMGIKTHATMGDFVVNNSERAAMAKVAPGLTGALKSIAGYNEPNGPGRPSNWAALTLDHQRWVWGLGQQLGIEVHSPSLHDQVPTMAQDFHDIGALGVGNLCDVIDIHRYPGGRSPSQYIDQRRALAQACLGPKPVDCSEGGYFTASKYTGHFNPISEAAQAAYAPRHLMEYVLRGMKFWQYELMDDPDKTCADRESNLGMVAVSSLDPSTWRKKPAFEAMSSLLSMTADPGPAFTPRPMRVSVEGPSDLRWVAAGRSDDSRFLILWRDVDVYNPTTKLASTVPPAAVTVTARRSRTIQVDGTLQFIHMGKNA